MHHRLLKHLYKRGEIIRNFRLQIGGEHTGANRQVKMSSFKHVTILEVDPPEPKWQLIRLRVNAAEKTHKSAYLSRI